MRSTTARLLSIATGIILAAGIRAGAEPVGTAFTYQGQLRQHGIPVSDTADFRFLLFDAETGGAQVSSILNPTNVGVVDGLFMVELDFGVPVFNGDARWMQIGALYPFSRGHSCAGTLPHEPWVFGEEVEEITREMLSLRYRLMPYLYSVFHKAAERGFPIWRALFLHYPDDPQTYHINDQILLGRYIMAAPILSLTLESGLKISSLANTIASLPFANLLILTNGVLPMV